LAKIAAKLRQALAERAARGAPGATAAHVLAEGAGWRVSDVVCTSGPRDRPFEERHADVGIAIVAAGTFEYRSGAGRDLMTPGSLLLGNAQQGFECAHDHGAGDRCLSFQFDPEYFARVSADAGGPSRFSANRLPPLPPLSGVIARALAGLAAGTAVAWEEIGVELVAQIADVVGTRPAADGGAPTPSAVARVARVVRGIERHPDDENTLGSLAREAGLSPYHFLRTFESVTGVTPHQYVLRTRLREAAVRLALEPARVLHVALDSGFGDVSNFNRAFRAEFGLSPRAFRATIPTHVR
jgi:AraC-like DNA-binding protein